MLVHKKTRHKNSQQRRRARLRAAGLCTCCGKGPGPTCEACLTRMRCNAEIRAAKRRSAGLCFRCAQPLSSICSMAVKYPQCVECFMKSTADHHLGDRHRWRELLQILERQKGLCAYTREPLVLGENASLDHKTPKARGGEDTPQNLQWVTWQANNCKRDLTHAEFVSLCRKVAKC